jgi:hypothetical protein
MWILIVAWALGAIFTAALLIVGHERNGTGAQSDGFVNFLIVAFWPPIWLLLALVLLMQRILRSDTGRLRSGGVSTRSQRPRGPVPPKK